MKYSTDELILQRLYEGKLVHIPRSDVFYVREHLRGVFGKNYTLDYVEWAMLKEGMIEAKDCYQPQTKLSWDEYPLEKETRCPSP
jgi:hypothetical protein